MRNPQDDLYRVMQREPWLCEPGRANRVLCRHWNMDLEYERNLLKSQIRQFQICRDWLKLCVPRKGINYKIPPSYRLKELVEGWSGERISNGSFIAGVLHLGILYQSYDSSLSIHIAISSRSPTLKNPDRYGMKLYL
jgi:hypothetical protein